MSVELGGLLIGPPTPRIPPNCILEVPLRLIELARLSQTNRDLHQLVTGISPAGPRFAYELALVRIWYIRGLEISVESLAYLRFLLDLFDELRVGELLRQRE